MARDGNSAANILSLAVTLLVHGEPPLALRWHNMERHWSFHATDPWEGYHVPPLPDPDGRYQTILDAAALVPLSRGQARYARAQAQAAQMSMPKNALSGIHIPTDHHAAGLESTDDIAMQAAEPLVAGMSCYCGASTPGLNGNHRCRF